MSARQAMLTIDALQGYIENIGNDAMNYLGSVENIGHLIDYEEKEAQKKGKRVHIYSTTSDKINYMI